MTKSHRQAHDDLGGRGSMTTDFHDGRPPANIDLTASSPTVRALARIAVPASESKVPRGHRISVLVFPIAEMA